ncbi:MAG: diguanylate cyclase [Planctomycetota bacterium]
MKFGTFDRSVTASLGVAGYTRPGMRGHSELLKRADEAVYAAKHQGRNRAVLSQEINPTGKAA